MRNGRRRSSGSARSGRRKLVWLDALAAQGLATNDNLVLDLLVGGRTAGASVLGATVIRTIVNLYQTSGTAAVPVTRGDQFYWGLCVTDSNDVGLNTVGAPNAHTTTNIDWAWRELDVATVPGGPAIIGATPQASYFGMSNSKVVDVRVKRKVQEMNQTWALVVNQASLGTAGGASWIWWTRTLIALP